MDNPTDLITVVFTGVRDTEQLDDVISSADTLVIQKLEQNNGIVAYVFKGIAPTDADNVFRSMLDDAGLKDVDFIISAGNAFRQ